MGEISEEEASTCPSCGATVGGDPFCPKCGAQLPVAESHPGGSEPHDGDGPATRTVDNDGSARTARFGLPVLLVAAAVAIVIVGFIGYSALSGGDEIPFCCTENSDPAANPDPSDSQASASEEVGTPTDNATLNSLERAFLSELRLENPSVSYFVRESGCSASGATFVRSNRTGERVEGEDLDCYIRGPATAFPPAGIRNWVGWYVVDDQKGLCWGLLDPASTMQLSGCIPSDLPATEEGGQPSTAPQGTAVQPMTEDGAGGSVACPSQSTGSIVDLRTTALACPDAYNVASEAIATGGSDPGQTIGPLSSGYTCQVGEEDAHGTPVVCTGEPQGNLGARWYKVSFWLSN